MVEVAGFQDLEGEGSDERCSCIIQFLCQLILSGN